MTKKAPQSVLFVCRMNAVRSPVAEALTRHYFPRQLYSRSCGIHKGPSDPFAASVMDEIGLDLGSHRSKTYEELGEGGFDLIVTLAPEAHHRMLEHTRFEALDIEYWPTLDPTLVEGTRSNILNSYRMMRDLLRSKLLARFSLSDRD